MASPAPSKRGGARPGAGRPTTDGATGLRRVSVLLDAATLAAATVAGDGNVSLGLRRLAQRAAHPSAAALTSAE